MNWQQALCHTLMHSLWEGLLLAVLAGVIITLTRHSSSATRYRWLVAVLFLYTAAVLFTFIAEMSGGVVAPDGFVYGVRAINEHSNAVALGWFVSISILAGRMLFNLYLAGRLKKVKVSEPEKQWLRKVEKLGVDLGIKRPLVLLESAIAEVPLVIGYLKPVVLMPMGLLNNLKQDEAEAILLHELAHILRKDYLVNIIQTVLEILFFFNPAVNWVSSLIRGERENCADDIVVSHTCDPAGYLRAMIRFEEYRRGVRPFAFAFTGSGGSVLFRMERMVAGTNRFLTKLESFVLALFLALGVLFLCFRPAFSLRTPDQPASFTAEAKAMEMKRKAEANAYVQELSKNSGKNYPQQ